MICPTDEQQCEYPNCLNPSINQYDAECARRKAEEDAKKPFLTLADRARTWAKSVRGPNCSRDNVRGYPVDLVKTLEETAAELERIAGIKGVWCDHHGMSDGCGVAKEGGRALLAQMGLASLQRQVCDHFGLSKERFEADGMVRVFGGPCACKARREPQPMQPERIFSEEERMMKYTVKEVVDALRETQIDVLGAFTELERMDLGDAVDKDHAAQHGVVDAFAKRANQHFGTRFVERLVANRSKLEAAEAARVELEGAKVQDLWR